MLCSVLFVSSVVIRVILHGYHDFVAKGPLWLERLTRFYLLSFRSSRHIDMVSASIIHDVVGYERRNM
jgi:hypothetical protein